MLRKFKALLYSIIGGTLTWTWYQQDNFAVAGAIAFFTICMVILTLSAFGKTTITWNDTGITVKSFPRKQKHLPWHELTEIKLDHLGYEIISPKASFHVSRAQMSENLLTRIKTSIKKDKP